MSANLYWEPVKRKKHSLTTMAPSSFMEKLERAFNSRTPTLRERDIPVLRGMLAVESGERERNDFLALIEALDHHEEIEITAEY